MKFLHAIFSVHAHMVLLQSRFTYPVHPERSIARPGRRPPLSSATPPRRYHSSSVAAAGYDYDVGRHVGTATSIDCVCHPRRSGHGCGHVFDGDRLDGRVVKGNDSACSRLDYADPDDLDLGLDPAVDCCCCCCSRHHGRLGLHHGLLAASQRCRVDGLASETDGLVWFD